MLSAAELCARLNEAALRMSPVAIVFDLEKGGEIVWHRPPKEGDLLAEVEALMRAGGRPIGLIGFLNGARASWFYGLPFRDLLSDEQAREFTERLADMMLEVCRRQGYPAYRIFPERN